MNSLFINGERFDGLKDVDIELPAFRGGKIPDFVKNIHIPTSASAELSFTAEINSNVIKQFVGLDLARCGDFTVEFQCPYTVQRRRHKKKRINKKWAKRYGYVTRFRYVRLNEVEIIRSRNEEINAIGRSIDYIT